MDLGLRAPNVVSQLKISARRQVLSGNTLGRFLYLCMCVHTYTHRSCVHTFPELQTWNYVCLPVAGGSLPSYHFLTIPWMPDFWLMPCRGGINSMRLNQQPTFRKVSPPPPFSSFCFEEERKAHTHGYKWKWQWHPLPAPPKRHFKYPSCSLLWTKIKYLYLKQPQSWHFSPSSSSAHLFPPTFPHTEAHKHTHTLTHTQCFLRNQLTRLIFHFNCFDSKSAHHSWEVKNCGWDVCFNKEARGGRAWERHLVRAFFM